MEFLEKLPLDLAYKVIDMYEDMERCKNLPRHAPIRIIQSFTCIWEDHCLSHFRIRENEFEFETIIRCDDQNMVWMSCVLYCNSWSGWAHNMYNVPIMYLRNQTRQELLQLVKLVKKCYFEYIKYNYTYSKMSFKNRQKSHYEIKYYNEVSNEYVSERCSHPNKLASKHLMRIIRHKWLNGNVEMAKQYALKYREFDDDLNWDAHPSLLCNEDNWRFRLDESCYDMGSKNIRVPYMIHDLRSVQTHLPIVYGLLQKHDHLWTPLRKMSANLKEYITLYVAYAEAVDNNELSLFMPAEEFNAKMNRLMEAFGFTHSIYCAHTGYSEPLDIHEIMEYATADTG
jgi:hypothetical protein